MNAKDALLANDARRAADLIKRAQEALYVRDYVLMRECLDEARPLLTARGVLVDAVLSPSGVPVDLAALVMNTQRFGSDWQRAIPSVHITHIVGAIVVVKDDGSLEAVKNRWGAQGKMFPGPPLPVRSDLSDDDMTAPAAAALAKMVFTGIGARDPEQPRLPRPTIPKLPRR